jgi:CheY-like chemotaxis protein/HPt (histidine-containing phosphotransfer) domain-containing protein
LLKNAIKFTPHGGCVGIHCRRTNGDVVIDVHDSGIGIEPESLSRIFNAFEQEEYSLARQFGGLGLGLAISKTLVEMHGGTIEAHSAGRNKGATFRIRLPLCVPARESELSKSDMSKEHVRRPLRILLVEDHGITAMMMRKVLNAEGHAVETAGDVATALELADKNGFDLLISDLGLPDGSGHELMRELRERRHTFPGIALSGYGQEEDIRRSREVGFAAHLTKPASREAIIEVVASIMAGEQKKAPDDAPQTSQTDAPAFDVGVALKECFGDQDVLAQMIQFFFDDVDKLLPQIHLALRRGDLAEVGRLGHRLKGTIIHLGAEPAKFAAMRVERLMLQGGEQAEAEEAGRIFERECHVLKTALAEHQAAIASTPHEHQG